MYEQLQIASSIIPKHPTLPILSLVRIDKEGVKSTDLTTWITAKIENPFMQSPVCVAPQIVAKLVKNSKTISFETGLIDELDENLQLRIANEKGVINIKAVNTVDFPAWPSLEGKLLASIEINQVIFNAIVKALNYTKKDKSYYQLTKVYLQLSTDKISVLATNGHVVFKFEQYANYVGDNISLTIEPETIQALKKVKFLNGTIGIREHDKDRYEVNWVNDQYEVIHRSDSAIFPLQRNEENQGKLTNNNGIIRVNRQAFKKALDLVYHPSTNTKESVCPMLILSYSENEICPLNIRYQVGYYNHYDFVGEWEIDGTLTGNLSHSKSICNPKYLTDIVKTIQDDYFGIKLSDNGSIIEIIADNITVGLMPIEPLTDEQIAEQVKEMAWIKYEQKLNSYCENGSYDYIYNGREYTIKKDSSAGYQDKELIIDGESQGFFAYLYQAHKEAFNRFYSTDIVAQPIQEPKSSIVSQLIDDSSVTSLPENKCEPVYQETEKINSVSQKEEKEVKQQTKKPRLNKPDAYCRSRSTVWESDAIGTMKPDSINGKVLNHLSTYGHIKISNYIQLGLDTPKQLHRALWSISRKGYGIQRDGDVYRLILPNGMTEPKFA